MGKCRREGRGGNSPTSLEWLESRVARPPLFERGNEGESRGGSSLDYVAKHARRVQLDDYEL